jgi:hypothetical protein
MFMNQALQTTEASPQQVKHETKQFLSAKKFSWLPPKLASRTTSHFRGKWNVRTQAALQRLSKDPFMNEEFVIADVSLSEARKGLPHGGFIEYSGDLSGRLIGVCGTVLTCNYPSAWELNSLIEKIKPWQKPDGHFGTNQQLEQEITIGKDLPILWGNGRLLIGLGEAYEAIKNPQALAAARALGDYYKQILLSHP